VFPNARVIGLDIDLTYWNESVSGLKKLGAFEKHYPEVYAFDKLTADNGPRIAEILDGDKIDMLIDDALHSDVSITNAFKQFRPFLADRFICFIEDNRTATPKLAETHPKYRIGQIAIIQPPIKC
jgi:hypothetical protein